ADVRGPSLRGRRTVAALHRHRARVTGRHLALGQRAGDRRYELRGATAFDRAAGAGASTIWIGHSHCVRSTSVANTLSTQDAVLADGDRQPLSSEELTRVDAYWRACNYLSVGMIYLRDNPLLREPLTVDHVKHRLLGHWGASPALSLVWIHLNRLI